MRTVPFKKVLHGAAWRRGLEPDVNLTTNQAGALTESINSAVREGLEKYNFPEFDRTERRAYRDAWDAGTAYVVDDEVYNEDDDTYYVAILGGTNHQPPNATYWEEAGDDFMRYVELEQTGQTKIGQVWNLFKENPSTSRTPGELGFDLSNHGIEPVVGAPNRVYVHFQLRPPEFTSTPWDSAATYEVDDLVYYPTTGECYIAILAGSNKNPEIQTTYWRKVDFPYVLAEFAKLYAVADSLNEEGQTDKAKAMRADAYDKLMDEFDNLEMRQDQHQFYAVKTQ